MTDVYEARAAIEELREAWAWLWLMMVPGPERRPGRPVDERQAEVLEARGRSDRTYRDLNLRAGLGALAPSAAPVRLDVLDAQAAVHRMVTGLAARVAGRLDVSYVGGRAGTTVGVLDVLSWLDVGGLGRPYVVDVDGQVWRAGVLDELRDRRVLADVARTLGAAAEIARQAVGVVGEPVRPIEHRCPACRHRSLQLHHEGRDKRLWRVSCVRRSCLCVGPGCGCLRRDRRPGLQHVWNRAEMDGPYGLATAVARAARVERVRIHSGAAGRGGTA